MRLSELSGEKTQNVHHSGSDASGTRRRCLEPGRRTHSTMVNVMMLEHTLTRTPSAISGQTRLGSRLPSDAVYILPPFPSVPTTVVSALLNTLSPVLVILRTLGQFGSGHATRASEDIQSLAWVFRCLDAKSGSTAAVFEASDDIVNRKCPALTSIAAIVACSSNKRCHTETVNTETLPSGQTQHFSL